MKISLSWKSLCSVLLMAISLPVLAQSSSSSNDVGNSMKDTMITTKIKANLTTSNVTHVLNISVETNNGVVTLSGTAQSDTEATTAIKIAESTDGVIDVNADKLVVSGSKEPLTDAYITAKVEGMFMRNNLTAGSENVPLLNIKIGTKQGVVYLSGKIDKNSQNEQAVKLAKSVNGVKEVISDLKAG
jgi:hyperosmotically inducible protein